MKIRPYQLGDTNLNRVVGSMREDARSHDLVEDYLDSLWTSYRDSGSAQHILNPIRMRAQDAFSHNLASAVEGQVADSKVTRAFREMPKFYVSKALKKGVVLGIAANYALLGKHTDELLIPRIDAMMPFTDVDHDSYIESLEAVAAQPYRRTAEEGQSNSLLTFADQLGEATYDDYREILLLKTGAALAYQAYRCYRLETNQAFSRLVHDMQ